MVKTYSKSARVNGLGFAWTGCPPPPPFAWTGLLLAPTVFPQVVCHALQRHTASSLHLPLFLEETFFMHPCFLTIYGMQIAHGQQLVYLKGFQTTVATKESLCPECMAGYVAHCGMWLGEQPRVGCGGWVQDVLLLFG